MIIERYDLQQVSDDKKLIEKIITMAAKFALYVDYKRTKGLSKNDMFVDTKSFDIDKLIDTYKKHSKNSARSDYKQKFDEFLAQMTDIRNKIQDVSR